MEKASVESNVFSRPEETSVLGLDSYYNLELSKLYDISILYYIRPLNLKMNNRFVK